MAYTSEIDKLEARWRENPKGRNFAPLADAYRKAGLIDNAIMLLETGLKLHPDYVSAHIVFARCLVDKKDDAGAENLFKKVLELDGENIIALRGLAELAGRNGRHEEEVEWLGRLLNADPMNGDAAEALARAKGKVAAKPVEATEAPTKLMPKPDFAVEHETPEPVSLTPPAAAAAAPSSDVENFETPISFNPGAHAAAKAEGLEVQEDVELNPQEIEQVEIEGLARTQYEGSGLFKLESAPPPEAAVDLPLIMPDDAARAPAPPLPPAPPRPAPPPSPRPRPPVAALPDDDGAADTATLSQVEPVLTETMAELYLKQGHPQDALRVYQALLAQRPGDARLKRKVEQLTQSGRKGSGVSAQAFLKGIWSGKGKPPQEAPQSTLAAAFDAAPPDPVVQAPGEPSHPAHDHISLDSVFGAGGGGGGGGGGEGASRANMQAPAPDAGVPAGEAPAGGFSFDEFFAGKGGAQPDAGGAGAPGGASTDAAAAKTPGAGRSSGAGRARPAEDEAEADQFQQWLKKLKS